MIDWQCAGDLGGGQIRGVSQQAARWSHWQGIVTSVPSVLHIDMTAHASELRIHVIKTQGLRAIENCLAPESAIDVAGLNLTEDDRVIAA